MSYRIELIPPARAEIRALCGYLRAQALELVAALGDRPRPPRARELWSRPEIHRIWLAGSWRVAYQVDETTRRVLILCLRHKESIAFDTLPSWMRDSSTDNQPAAGASLRIPTIPTTHSRAKRPVV